MTRQDQGLPKAQLYGEADAVRRAQFALGTNFSKFPISDLNVLLFISIICVCNGQIYITRCRRCQGTSWTKYVRIIWNIQHKKGILLFSNLRSLNFKNNPSIEFCSKYVICIKHSKAYKLSYSTPSLQLAKPKCIFWRFSSSFEHISLFATFFDNKLWFMVLLVWRFCQKGRVQS